MLVNYRPPLANFLLEQPVVVRSFPYPRYAFLPPSATRRKSLLKRYSSILGVVQVMPGVGRLVLRPLGGQLFPDNGGVISFTIAGGFGSGKAQRTTATAPDYHTLWKPPVDLAELHVLDLIAPFGTLDDRNHSTIPFPTGRTRPHLSISPVAGLYDHPGAPNRHEATRPSFPSPN
jgi:hypothetical protein